MRSFKKYARLKYGRENFFFYINLANFEVSKIIFYVSVGNLLINQRYAQYEYFGYSKVVKECYKLEKIVEKLSI